VATVNQTRRHASTYEAYVFLKDNVDPVLPFFKTQHNDQAKVVAQELGKNRTTIETELNEHATSLGGGAMVSREYP
jgi:hypothetical protein